MMHRERIPKIHSREEESADVQLDEGSREAQTRPELKINHRLQESWQRLRVSGLSQRLLRERTVQGRGVKEPSQEAMLYSSTHPSFIHEVGRISHIFT